MHADAPQIEPSGQSTSTTQSTQVCAAGLHTCALHPAPSSQPGAQAFAATSQYWPGPQLPGAHPATQVFVAGSQRGPPGSPAQSSFVTQSVGAGPVLDEVPTPELDWLAPVVLDPVPPLPPLPGVMSTLPQPTKATVFAMKMKPGKRDECMSLCRRPAPRRDVNQASGEPGFGCDGGERKRGGPPGRRPLFLASWRDDYAVRSNRPAAPIPPPMHIVTMP